MTSPTPKTLMEIFAPAPAERKDPAPVSGPRSPVLFRISWLDAAHQTSYVHLTTAEATDTLCGTHARYLTERRRIQAPGQKDGVTNRCRQCRTIATQEWGCKSLAFPWHPTCLRSARITQKGAPAGQQSKKEKNHE
jgi:hypothetical protein